MSAQRRGVRLSDDPYLPAGGRLREHAGRHGAHGDALRVHQGPGARREALSTRGPHRRERVRQRRQHAPDARVHERAPGHRRDAPRRPPEVRHRHGRAEPDGIHPVAARLQVRQLRERAPAADARQLSADAQGQRVLLQRLPVVAAQSRPTRRVRQPEGAHTSAAAICARELALRDFRSAEVPPREDAVPPARQVTRQRPQTAVNILPFSARQPEGRDNRRRK